jgi:hypothetical protein
VLLRGLVLTSTVVAITCTRFAAYRTVPVLDVAIVCLALVCAAVPDSHTGLLVVALVGIEWWATVDDRVTPWSLAAAAALAVFHVSMAAASLAPVAARWTPAMSRRWLRRTAVLGAAICITWAGLAAIGDHRVRGNEFVLAAALIVVACAALWARTASIAHR